MSRTVTAVVDRIVDGRTAVLLVETEHESESENANESESGSEENEGKPLERRDETDADRPIDQLDVDVEALPEDGRHEGAVFDVELENGGLVDATYRPEETRDRRERAQDRFDRLSERLPNRNEE